MNEDYLWDRTGTDAGIEDLERKLAPFRLKTKEAPRAVPAAEPRSRPRFGFRLAFAGLSFASVLVVAFVFFAGGLGSQDPGSLSVRVESAPSTVSAVEIPDAPSVSKAVSFRETAAGSVNRRRRAAAQTEPMPALPAPEQPAEDHLATLTEEEREAYDKLMLALSVTTSSLKLVQDKADGDSLAGRLPADEEVPQRSN
ncbi:MAG: hypothetical protein IPM63_17280 [Acidobacteriota bacterium]|nr:MAG: hypothetical protein IPM63_17280 [Acidobacteriota bacterium]